MDVISLIWTLAAVLIFGSYLIFVVPIPTILTTITMGIIIISVRTKKEKKNEHDKK